MLQHSTSTELFTSRTGARETGPPSAIPSGHQATQLTGRPSILAVRPLLASLASRSGQAGETDSLEFFLRTPDAIKKVPHLLMLGEEQSGGGNAANGLSGAALLFEYQTAMGRSRVFSTSDTTGRRNLLAPPFLRALTAARAARTLIERGAHVVHIAFCETHHSEQEHRNADGSLAPHVEVPHAGFSEQVIGTELRRPSAAGSSGKWAFVEREIPAYLELLSTFDATLARIGQRTRSNLRYYRRRAEIELGAVFVPSPRLSREEFLEFNRQSTFAVADRIAIHRFETLSAIGNCSLQGVRDAQGRWLSLAGIRRHGRYTEIDWQMNRNDLPAHSLGIVLRSYLIEHEIARGSTRLYIEGGTPHPIGRSFLRQRVGELTVARDSAYVGLLKRFATRIFPAKNYVGQILGDPNLRWNDWQGYGGAVRTQSAR